MKRFSIFIICVALMAISGCRDDETKTVGHTTMGSISRWHDDGLKVTCWVYASGYKGGISCIPDSQLK